MGILRDFPYIVWVGNIVTPVINYVSSACSRVQRARALLSVTTSIFDLMWFVVMNIIILKVQPLKRQLKNDTIPMVYFDTIPCIQNTGKSTALVCLLRGSHRRCDFSSARCSLQVSAIERVQSLLPYVWLLRWRAWSLHWAISQVLRIKIPKEFLRSGFDWPQWWWEYSFSVLPCVFCHYNIWVTFV